MKRANIKLYQLLAIIVVLFTGFSCSDKFFDEQDGNKITPDQHYKTISDADVSRFGAIIPLQNVMPKLIVLDGLRSDQMDVTENADLYLKAINDQLFTADNPYLDASDYYKVIININELLANVKKVNELDRNFDDYYMYYYTGALIGMRSWTYLQLLKLYNKAAWIDDNMTSLPENLQQTMMTREVLIDTLINQTQKRIFDPLVDNRFEFGLGNGYVNPKAVLGELYLERGDMGKGDYVNSVKYIKMALESYLNTNRVFKVDGSLAEVNWRSIFSSAEDKFSENIFAIPFNKTEGQFNPLPQWMMYTDQYMVKPTNLLVDSFNAQIQLKGAVGDGYRGVGTSIDTTAAGIPFINKYSLDTDPLSSDIVISRAADLHLLLAEAYNRSGDEKSALILLNAGYKNESVKAPAWNENRGIRGRAFLMNRVVPDSLSVINGTDTTKVVFEGEARTEYIEDLIIDERAMELAFEGKRWFDLVRIANRRNDPAYLADKVAAKFEGTSKYSTIRSKLMDPANWYLPVR
jgi:tetratricopeptide (TPR) repeat protein